MNIVKTVVIASIVAHYLQPHCDGELINLDGGVDAWAREIDPSMPVY